MLISAFYFIAELIIFYCTWNQNLTADHLLQMVSFWCDLLVDEIFLHEAVEMYIAARTN